MTARPLHRAALLALATGGVLAGTAVALPTASADRHDPPAVQGPPAPGRDFIGPTQLHRSAGMSSLHAPVSTGPLARKFK